MDDGACDHGGIYIGDLCGKCTGDLSAHAYTEESDDAQCKRTGALSRAEIAESCCCEDEACGDEI